MGVCGCGDFNADFQFPGPEGITYVLQVYPPCDYCDTPAGIILYAMGPEDCREWGVEELPILEVRDIGTAISVVDPRELVKSILIGIEQYIEDGLSGEFRGAVFAAIQENRKRLT